MAVSKRVRFEVLRRDGHTCRYCGATAEDGPLSIEQQIAEIGIGALVAAAAESPF